MYVARNRNTPGHKTEILDEKKNVVSICIRDWDFIPNSDFDIIDGLISDDPDNRAVVHGDSTFHTQTKLGILLSEKKKGDFIHPCVYTMPKTSPIKFFYAKERIETKGHFGTPKVIFGSDGVGDIICDYTGEFGLTQFAIGVLDDPENLDHIRDALKSDKFRRLMKSVCVGKAQYNRRVMKLFRKDFWKEFI